MLKAEAWKNGHMAYFCENFVNATLCPDPPPVNGRRETGSLLSFMRGGLG
jgi:hypothetical protein